MPRSAVPPNTFIEYINSVIYLSLIIQIEFLYSERKVSRVFKRFFCLENR